MPLDATTEPAPKTALDVAAGALCARFGHLSGEALLRPVLTEVFPGRVALVSSFGSEAAVLLAMVAAIDPATPVLFLDTGKHFGETLRYRDALVRRLGLCDVRALAPDPAIVASADPEGRLWYDDPDRCCALRKVAPLAGGLAGFSAWISGRKRYQSLERAALPLFEAADGRIKVNPLAGWTREAIDAEFVQRDLPHHPLEADGFLSIGCMPCTDRVAAGESARAGRWRHREKTECGIHLSLTSAAL